MKSNSLQKNCSNNISKYFWDQGDKALRETVRILKNPGHPQFPARLVALLSRCDKPDELFGILPKKKFVESWPRIRSHWLKRERESDFRDWWETIYEQLVVQRGERPKKVKGSPPSFFVNLGRLFKEARLERGLSQKQVALSIGMRQPDISKIEEGRINMTLNTLMRLCKVLGIERIDVDPQKLKG